MTQEHHSAALQALLADFDGTKSRSEILSQAARMHAPSALLARLEVIPDGTYDRDSLVRALPPEEDLWRSGEATPLADLDRALATYSSDGQADDTYGGDAGAEEEFGSQEWPGKAAAGGDPDPESTEGRRLRPSPEGRTGPDSR
jgi:hypothetical protein